MPAELVIRDCEALLSPPVVGFGLTRFAGALGVPQRVVGESADREACRILWVKSEGVLKGGDGLLILTSVVEGHPEIEVTELAHWVQYERAPNGGYAGLSAAHLDGEAAVQAQHLRIARRECQRPLELFIRPGEIQPSVLEIVR